MEAKLQATNARVRDYQDAVLVALDRAVALRTRVDDARALVATQEARIRAQRLQLEQSSLWEVGAASARLEVVVAELATAWRSLGIYLARNGTFLAGCSSAAGADWLAFTRARPGAAGLRAPFTASLPLP
jgi:hypothetical protein